jgi:hypothetical protein
VAINPRAAYAPQPGGASSSTDIAAPGPEEDDDNTGNAPGLEGEDVSMDDADLRDRPSPPTPRQLRDPDGTQSAAPFEVSQHPWALALPTGEGTHWDSQPTLRANGAQDSNASTSTLPRDAPPVGSALPLTGCTRRVQALGRLSR